MSLDRSSRNRLRSVGFEIGSSGGIDVAKITGTMTVRVSRSPSEDSDFLVKITLPSGRTLGFATPGWALGIDDDEE